MPRGRPSGSRNKANHNAGGARRGKHYEEERAKKERAAAVLFEQKAAENRRKTGRRESIPHPKCPVLLEQSHKLLQDVVAHASMPKCRHFPVMIAVEESNEEFDYESDHDEDDSPKAMRFR